MTLDKKLEQACEMIRSHVTDVKLIYQFGSYGTKNQRRDSDLDLAILCKHSPSTMMIWELAQELAIQINCDVDLLDLSKGSTVLCYEVVTTGRCLYYNNESDRNKFEMFILRDYLDYKELLNSLINDIKKRGRVYD